MRLGQRPVQTAMSEGVEVHAAALLFDATQAASRSRKLQRHVSDLGIAARSGTEAKSAERAFLPVFEASAPAYGLGGVLTPAGSNHRANE
jgi:hypothetical protein